MMSAKMAKVTRPIRGLAFGGREAIEKGCTMATRWRAFPYADAAYDYQGAALKKHWPRLHKGDCEPYPEPRTLKKLGAAHAGRESSRSPENVAEVLQDAWRSYHRGDFGHAMEAGVGLGPIGYDVANKAANVYATYLEPDERRKLALLQESARRAEELQACAKDVPNAWYFHAQALGRYSQGISIARALTQGLAGIVRKSLEQAIALEPRHSDAHIALGLYHAELINKVGALIAGLTYGASREAGLEHFKTALKLNPQSAIARIEYANGLIMMFGKDRTSEASRLYHEAAACTPLDAMERFDVELARAQLKD
jgi:tetratricopeptide (TPR) repeat protein